MKILVTGADGFVGRYAVRRLVSSGHDVAAMTEDGGSPDGVPAWRADVRDHHVVLRVLEAARPDALLHLAAIAFLPAVRRDPRGAFEVNANGTLSLLAAAAAAAPQARVVVISSSEVYGKAGACAGAPLTEDRPLEPATFYGASKAAAEHVARAYAEEGLDVVVLRPFNHIGPGQAESYVVSSFAHQVARLERQDGERVLRHGNLDAVRDFLDVRDVVEAYERVLTAPRGALRPGAAYNVCSGSGVRIGDLVSRLAGRAARPLRAEVDPERLRAVDVPVFVGSAERLRAAVGFAPRFALDQTLADVLADARRRVASPDSSSPAR
ncbi:MAG: GDP-mannose 4,6-dehydratase [Planctomycetes bacterium]|nr:GDP-mannose 4,6-dehydratase [Planctomycetota bacterium]